MFLKYAGIGMLAGACSACQRMPELAALPATSTPAPKRNPKPTLLPTPTAQPTPTFIPEQLPYLLSDKEIKFLATHEVREGDTTRPVLMMTYDDNAKYDQVRTILDAYKNHNAKATFFFIGEKIFPSSKAVHAIVEEGHELGCHGWGHANLLRLTDDEVNRAFENCFKVMHEVVPGYRLRFVRFPFGEGNADPRLLWLAAQWGLQHVFWTTGSGGLDSKTLDNVLRNARNGAIILSHMFRPFDVSQAERIVAALVEKGFSLETVASGRKSEDIFSREFG